MKKNQQAEALPCPFCGEHPTVHRTVHHINVGKPNRWESWGVRCHNTDCQARTLQGWPSRGGAVKCWNRRTEG